MSKPQKLKYVLGSLIANVLFHKLPEAGCLKTLDTTKFTFLVVVPTNGLVGSLKAGLIGNNAEPLKLLGIVNFDVIINIRKNGTCKP